MNNNNFLKTPWRAAHTFVHHFKEFAMRDNIIDMAVGVIIGSACSKLVSSLVQDILMPPFGLLLGGINLTNFKITLQEGVYDAQGIMQHAPIDLNIGLFVQAVIDFLFLALSLFFAMQLIKNIKHHRSWQLVAIKPPLSTQEQLLTDIKIILHKMEQGNQHLSVSAQQKATMMEESK